MGIPSASYSITMRVTWVPTPGHRPHHHRGRRVGGHGGGGRHRQSHPELLVVDLTCNAVDARHAGAITQAVGGIEGADVHAVSDRTFLLHLGGKLEIASKVPLRTRDDLSMAYTPGWPGVPGDRRQSGRRPQADHQAQHRGRGHRRLGRAQPLGNIGPEAAMPVMEGKALLFKQFAGVDRLAGLPGHPGHRRDRPHGRAPGPRLRRGQPGGHRRPRCFEVERGRSLDIPVFHDDQHGTAIVVLAALTNALRVVGKELDTQSGVVLSGSGAAGVAIIKILQAEGAGQLVACDRSGVLHKGRELDEQALGGRHPQPHDSLKDPARRPGRRGRVRRGQVAPASSSRPTSPPWARTRSYSPWPAPIPRSTRPAPPRRRGRHRTATTSPTRSTTCSPSRGVFRGALDAGAHHLRRR